MNDGFLFFPPSSEVFNKASFEKVGKNASKAIRLKFNATVIPVIALPNSKMDII